MKDGAVALISYLTSCNLTLHCTGDHNINIFRKTFFKINKCYLCKCKLRMTSIVEYVWPKKVRSSLWIIERCSMKQRNLLLKQWWRPLISMSNYEELCFLLMPQSHFRVKPSRKSHVRWYWGNRGGSDSRGSYGVYVAHYTRRKTKILICQKFTF